MMIRRKGTVCSMWKAGLDIGSTTIKSVILDEEDRILYQSYERHYSHIVERAEDILRKVDRDYLNGRSVLLSISGSAGMGLAKSCGVPFVQEVFATRVAVNKLQPGTDCVIELGGEDAKILFLTNGLEVRMNGSCAGGTGAFIDQMATLLKMGADEMNQAAREAQRTYTIASRCGVFAKSDVQPLINQGAQIGDVAASIYKAVVNQTIAGLAQGRKIAGKVLYLGGPLTFSDVLRASFDETLGVKGVCPANSLYYVSIGAALYSDREFILTDVARRLRSYSAGTSYASQPPLFENREEYEAFRARHARARVETVARPGYDGEVYIGIDSGSTTVKAVVVDRDFNLLKTAYMSNNSVAFSVINLRQGALDQELDYIYKNSYGKAYYVYRPEGLSSIARDLLEVPNGLYQFSFESVLQTDMGRAYLPLEVETYIMNRSGRDETGYFAPLQ